MKQSIMQQQKVSDEERIAYSQMRRNKKIYNMFNEYYRKLPVDDIIDDYPTNKEYLLMKVSEWFVYNDIKPNLDNIRAKFNEMYVYRDTWAKRISYWKNGI